MVRAQFLLKMDRRATWIGQILTLTPVSDGQCPRRAPVPGRSNMDSSTTSPSSAHSYNPWSASAGDARSPLAAVCKEAPARIV